MVTGKQETLERNLWWASSRSLIMLVGTKTRQFQLGSPENTSVSVRESFTPDFRAKLQRHFLRLGRKSGRIIGRRIGRKFSAHFRASFAVQNDPQIFSQNSFQFIIACLVAEILKFHLRELLGFEGRKIFCPTRICGHGHADIERWRF